MLAKLIISALSANFFNVSQVQGMSSVFSDRKNFNESIGSWDVSYVRNRRCTFFDAKNSNQDIDLGMFHMSQIWIRCFMVRNPLTNTLEIGMYILSGVTTMKDRFDGASVFNEHIGSWNVSSVMHI
jgi:hypothetical protein